MNANGINCVLYLDIDKLLVLRENIGCQDCDERPSGIR